MNWFRNRNVRTKLMMIFTLMVLVMALFLIQIIRTTLALQVEVYNLEQEAEELKRLEASEEVKAVPKNEVALLLSAALNITSAYVELKSSQAALTEELNRRFHGLAARLSQGPHWSLPQ